jgi:hypothetical protein
MKVDFDFGIGDDRFSESTRSGQRRNKSMTDARRVSTRTNAVTNRARILVAAHSIFTACGLELDLLGMDHSLDELAQRFAHSLQAGLLRNIDS